MNCYHGVLLGKITMHCVKSEQTIEDTIKKSRFIGVITPCSSETEAIKILQQLQLQHSNATHIAFAYRINTDKGIIYRFHDAGEPSGTAGRPIFQHLDGKNLIDILIAVIRYFGGIKLGAGGLTRAYGNTAKKVIEAAELYPFIALSTITVELDYKKLQNLEYHLQKLQGQIVSKEFSENIKLTICIPADNIDALRLTLK
jgi:uncharacterized YigZ family protein